MDSPEHRVGPEGEVQPHHQEDLDAEAPEAPPGTPPDLVPESPGLEARAPHEEVPQGRRYPNLDEACRRYSLNSEDESGGLRYSPPPPYNNEFQNYPRKLYTTSVSSDKDRIELRIRCPSISSLRWCLKLYCLVFGGIGSILSFLWVIFHFYVLGETDSVDLRLQRYLDIALGFVWLFSTICLIYGGYSESKNWIVIYTTGSLCVLVLYWSWSVYTGYVQLETPAYSDDVENIGIFLTVLYLLLLVPVLLFYRSLVKPEQQVLQRGGGTAGAGACRSQQRRYCEPVSPRSHATKLEMVPREY